MGQIAKTIGATFGPEVLASSLAGLPFSWGPSSVDWPDGALSDVQVAALTTLVNAHDPTKKSPRLASGKQLTEALADLGALAAWDAAVMATHKPADRYYWLNAYSDMVPEGNMKLARLAAAAGVTVSALFDRAVTEPAV
jgi:hypothetical protein